MAPLYERLSPLAHSSSNRLYCNCFAKLAGSRLWAGGCVWAIAQAGLFTNQHTACQSAALGAEPGGWPMAIMTRRGNRRLGLLRSGKKTTTTSPFNIDGANQLNGRPVSSGPKLERAIARSSCWWSMMSTRSMRSSGEDESRRLLLLIRFEDG